MNFKVQVPVNAREKIASWGLPDEIVTEIYSRFVNELQRRPLDVLRTISSPVRLLQYSFVTMHGATKFTFVFAVELQPDDITLLVGDAWKIAFVKRFTGKKLPVAWRDESLGSSFS